MKPSTFVLVVLVLFSSLLPSPAEARPRLGFALEVSTDGFFSTTLVEVKVASVRAGSPSEKAGLEADDLILEMNGNAIKGASGSALKKSLAAVKQGDHVLLKVQRTGAGILVIDILAVP